MPGNITTFNDLDIIRAFMLLDKQLSRSILMKNLKLGEGSIRGILTKLKEKGLIVSTKTGHTYSEKGKAINKKIIKHLFYPIKIENKLNKQILGNFFPIYPNEKIVSCQLFNIDMDIKHIFIYRDFAIKAGCDGALILKVVGGKFILPGFEDLNENILNIKNNFDLTNDSLIIISLGENEKICERGIINVVDKISNIFKDVK
jgi:hypothetical protein